MNGTHCMCVHNAHQHGEQHDEQRRVNCGHLKADGCECESECKCETKSQEPAN